VTRLSVVVPAYNNADFIADTMRSILQQDYEDFEVIVADHSSTDDTVAVLQKFAGDPRVTLLSTPAGGGAHRNWQRVTDAATGELVKLVCGDDLLYPGALSAQVRAFDENPDAVLVASRRDILDARGEPLIRRRGLRGLTGLVDGGRAIRESVRAGTNLLGEPACVMVRRAVLQEAGGWDADAAYLIDQSSYARVLERGSMVGLRRAHAGFRVNAGQWSVALAADQARQAHAFHERVARELPHVVSRADVRVGNLRARINAVLRRVIYVVYARRLRAP
jgi:glycosyltransferase involved in cell wall biosynthesis